jgi:hypothetical protein
MCEAGERVFAGDRRVAVAAELLDRLTAVYIEDAPRIAELTIRAIRQTRAANQTASPLEMLEGASQWRGPGGQRGNIPRKFSEFAAPYQSGRSAGKDHATTLAEIQPPG